MPRSSGAGNANRRLVRTLAPFLMRAKVSRVSRKTIYQISDYHLDGGGDDLIGVGGPHEGLGVAVGLGEEAFDCGLEIDERSEHSALQPSPGQFGEEALDGIEPGCRWRRVVEHKTRMAIEPGPHLGILVAAVIAEDDVHDLARRSLCLDRIEKSNEFPDAGGAPCSDRKAAGGSLSRAPPAHLRVLFRSCRSTARRWKCPAVAEGRDICRTRGGFGCASERSRNRRGPSSRPATDRAESAI